VQDAMGAADAVALDEGDLGAAIAKIARLRGAG
jgi:hypothetical protein